MKKHLLKSLLVGAMTLAATGAWAGDKTVVKYSFDDATSPALTAGTNASLDYTHTSVISNTPFLNIWGANSSNGATNISLGSADLTEETWTLQFDWSGMGGANKKAGHTYLKAGDTNLFDIVDDGNWAAYFTLNYGDAQTAQITLPACDKNYRLKAASGDKYNTTDAWYRFTIVGSSDGVKLTIANASSGTAVVSEVVLSATNVNPTSLALNPSSCGAVGIDELSLTYYVEGEVIQTPIANYTKVDGISRTVTATCDTEGAVVYNSTDGETWAEGAAVTVSESGKIYFKGVKGSSESDVLEFDAVAGEAIVLNAPVINRSDNTTVTITADQTNLLLSPDATIHYTYGEESGSFTGSKTLTVEADATITAYAEYEGYTTSETSERAVALFPTTVKQIENTASKTSGWSANAFSDETITASERTYAALLLDDAQWGTNVYFQTDGAWGFRASGNWYINSDTEESWILMPNMKKGNIIVVNVTYPASSTVNATYSKYSFGTRYAYEVTEDGDVELAFKKINAKTMDYLYGVYAYAMKTDVEIAKDQLADAIAQATALNAYANDADLTEAIAAAQAAVDSEEADLLTVVAVGVNLSDKATAAAKTTLTKTVELARTLNVADAEATAAEAVLAKEDATVQEYAAALQALYAAALPSAKAYMAQAKAFFATFDGEAAEALAEDFTAVETALEGTSVDALRTAVQQLIADGTPYAKTALGKVIEYVDIIDNEELETAVAEAQAAIYSESIMAMVAAAQKLQTTFLAVAPAYIAEVKAFDTEGKEGVEALNAAIAAAEAAVAAEDATVVTVALAIRNLVKAVEEYQKANFEPTDCTALVSTTDWLSEQGSVGKYTKDVDQKEQYLTNTTTVEGDVLYQVVEGLTDGTYTVELYANSSYTAGRGFTSAALNGELGRTLVYAGDVAKTIPVVHQTAVGENNIVTLEGVVVTDGTLRMGIRKIAPGANWHTIQIKSLTLVSLNTTANAAEQDAYWTEIAKTVAAYEAYANVAGVEKAAIAATETKAAAIEAIPAFYAAKEGYDALAEIIAKANSVSYDVTDAEALIAAADATAEQAAAKAEELKHPVNLAVNTAAVAGAAKDNPVETNFVINGTFDTKGVTAPWKTTTGAQNQTTANNQSGAFGIDNSYFFENWNPSAFTGKIFQEIEDIPNGNYTLKIAAFVNNFDASVQHVYANADQTALTTGEPTAYEVNTIVTNNKIEIGLEQTSAVANWMGIDNVSLVYYGETNVEELVAAYEAALAAAQAVKGAMNATVKAALDAAIAAEVDMTDGDALTEATVALNEAVAAANTSIAAYANAAKYLPINKAELEGTNLYTAAAYKENITDVEAGYEDGSLTDEKANSLTDIRTGWRAANYIDDILMSAWDANVMDWGTYHVNTWSTEGDSDGSEFKAPFIEYWTGDGESLGEKTLTATIDDLENGKCTVTARVRVRVKNGDTSAATGITMQVNDGEAVSVTTGDKVGTTQFYLGEFTAKGDIADGVLTFKFIVAADNNISWLSFKDVKYVVEVATGISDATFAGQSNAAEGIYNLAGQKVQQAQKGLYIIGGKKVVK